MCSSLEKDGFFDELPEEVLVVMGLLVGEETRSFAVGLLFVEWKIGKGRLEERKRDWRVMVEVAVVLLVVTVVGERSGEEAIGGLSVTRNGGKWVVVRGSVLWILCCHW